MSIPTVIAPYLTYIKVGAALALLAAVAAGGYHFGGLSSAIDLANYKTDVGAQHAAQLKTVADAYQAQVIAAEADHVHMQGIIDELNKKLSTPDPTVAGLAQRVLDAEAAAASTACSRVPQTGAGAAATQGVQAKGAGGNPVLERLRQLTQAVYDAANDDDDYLDAAIKLLP